ncbi:MAG: 2-dehydro-3-deoxy-6-phosphogalactonate aldolase, partial [Gammaproteobacteria bacterium]|nr:2-dehydro-3-deoxy-6-phosphogalactonate aldolase [Gammaproteobacteria bacterium]
MTTTTPMDKFTTLMAALPLVAILRGLRPDEAADIGDAIIASGIRLLEVPLNSPQPLDSIATLRQRFPDALVGAGTVLDAQQVRAVHEAGGELVVAPNFDAEVVREAVRLGMVCLPGVLTPTEAFGALAAGATGLKLFPAELASPAAVKALLAVLPPGTHLMPVGGVTPQGMAAWRAAGATGFGIGSALYKPGR